MKNFKALLKSTPVAIALLLILTISSVVIALNFWSGQVSHNVEIRGLEGLLFSPESSSNYVDMISSSILVNGYNVFTWEIDQWVHGAETRESVGLCVIGSYEAVASTLKIDLSGVPEGVVTSISYSPAAWCFMLSENRLYAIESSEISLSEGVPTSIDGSQIVHTEILTFETGGNMADYSNCGLITFEFDVTNAETFGSFPISVTISLGE